LGQQRLLTRQQARQQQHQQQQQRHVRQGQGTAPPLGSHSDFSPLRALAEAAAAAARRSR
jgi:hypothetical protein